MSYPAPNGYHWEMRPTTLVGYTNNKDVIGGIVYDKPEPIYRYGWILVKDNKIVHQ